MTNEQYEEELMDEEPQAEQSERKNNLRNFINKPGNRILIGASLIVIILIIAITLRPSSMAEGGANEPEIKTVRVPTAPNEIIISEAEAKRLDSVSITESKQARERGESYAAAYNLPNQGNPATIVDRKQKVVIEPFELSRNYTMPSGNAKDVTVRTEREERALAELQKEYERQIKKREDRIKKIEDSTSKKLIQFERIINQPTRFTVTHYDNSKEEESKSGTNSVVSEEANKPEESPLIKTGSYLYAELEHEVNTDKGTEVIATVRGGEWDGSVLIGSVEMRQENIGVYFKTLAPQDNRPVVSIDAVAIRIKDASMGIAESINKHTLYRYSSLIFSSAIKGAGEVASRNTGTTVIQDGQVIQTNNKVTDREIIGGVMREVGSAASAEVAQGFNRPPTYKTPAGTGIAIFFMSDVR